MSAQPKIESETQPAVFEALKTHDHELVMFCNDNESGLKAIIAVHNTILGPAMGGLRMWPYASEADALKDVLRLSRGMTLKNALAGINVGGGKAVIIGDARKDKTEALIRRFGKFVNNLGGKYYTAEDVGMGEEDMRMIRMETPYVTGLPKVMGGSGDPSPVTAYGVYLGMKAAVKYQTGSDSLSGKKVMVQGAGSVAGHLVRQLVKEGADVLICDLYEEVATRLSAETGARVVPADSAYDQDVDIYSPCALGGTVNAASLSRLKAGIICGAANNQLLDEITDSILLREKGILYAPDFMVNCGGIINVSLELDRYSEALAMRLTEKVYDTTLSVLRYADQKGITTHQAALQLAEQRLSKIGHNRLFN